MVCTSTTTGSRIAGGFVLLNVAALVTAWRACQARPLGIGDFRAWLACRELEARRCRIHETRDRSPSYRVAELAKLIGVTEKRARASVRRLVEAGLIEWSAEAIEFHDHVPDPTKMIDEAAQSPDLHVVNDDIKNSIGGGEGSLAIPRRILRFLVAGAAPAMIATVLGLLLRCLSRRKGGFDGRGRVKASWIARVFAVDLRRVKAARRELVALGWIEPESSNQSAENRWGRAYRINLAWEQVKAGGHRLPPLPAVGWPAIATPSVDQEPLRERIQNQEPGGRTGFSIECPGDGDKPLPSPKLADVRIEDMKDTGRLLDLHGQAVAKGLVTASEADRLRFVGGAEHALAIATNPAALFAWLVLNRCWRYITGADEDSARRRLRVHDFGMPRVSAHPRPLAFSSSRPIEPGGLSEDARIVKAIREASIRAGIYRDPWPTFAARYPDWTRERWDRALVEV
jgi:hypothetical protein